MTRPVWTPFTTASVTPNILDYGVKRNSPVSQTTAIKRALDANPGQAFYFPTGDYRLETQLDITQSNSLILHPDARIYAASPMSIMLNYAPALPAGQYAEDKAIIGGTLDGNLNAGTILSLGQLLHFTHTRTRYKNGINRGLVTRAGAGAELFAYDLRFLNTGTTNVSDNIAIESNMGDSHYRDIVMRDWTGGVKDTAANRWDLVHPWIGPNIGGVNQMTLRYPGSFAFDITGMSDLFMCYADSYNTAFRIRTNGTSYTPPARVFDSTAYWNTAGIPDALATANPSYILNVDTGIECAFDHNWMIGHTNVPTNFITGDTSKLNAERNNVVGYVTGYNDYLSGVVQGTTTFTPTMYGSSTAGTPTYTTQNGTMTVNRGTVNYVFQVKATLDSNIAGNLRVGGLPLPSATSHIRTGGGTVSYASGTSTTGFIVAGGTSTELTAITHSASTSAEVSTTSLRGTVVEIWGNVTLTYY